MKKTPLRQENLTQQFIRTLAEIIIREEIGTGEFIASEAARWRTTADIASMQAHQSTMKSLIQHRTDFLTADDALHQAIFRAMHNMVFD